MGTANGPTGSKVSTRDARKGDPLIQAGRDGYLAAKAGEPFDPFYSGNPKAQCNYEVGRCWATNLRAAGIDPPPWRKNFPPSLRLTVMLNLSFVTVGGCLPSKGDGRDYEGCSLGPPPPAARNARKGILDRKGRPLPVPTYCER